MMTDVLDVSLTRRTLLGLLAAAGLVGTTGCGAELDLAAASLPREPAEATVRPNVATSLTTFTGRLLGRLERGRNLICSPLSVSVALAMVRNGARGATATEMDAALGYPDLTELNPGLNTLDLLLAGRNQKIDSGTRTGTVRLDLVNQVFGDQSLTWRPALLEVVARYYGTGIARADFAGDPAGERETINAWVADQTNDTITELLGPQVVTHDTRMVLVNAIYLKAPWLLEFNAAEPGPFRTGTGDVTADLMTTSYLGHAGRGSGWTAVRIPYLGGDLAMTVVLPDEGAEDQLVEGLADGELDTILTGLPDDVQIDLTMPRWRFRTAVELRSVLSDLGMPTAFTDQADFTGLTGDAALLITHVVHQGWIAVDEQGTEASAATAVVAAPTSARVPDNRIELRLDRPFWYVIHDVPTATPLLAGRVGDPTSAS